MKYGQIFIDNRIRNATLIVLLICMSIAWLFDSDYWYNIAVLIVSVSFILHGVNDYIVGKHKARGTVIILLSVLFTLYNLLRIFFL
ncbi:hypothetical protein [Priestia megaterium]|uniref:hypothetical protein n=1 Tax=Priestia megaterium TaxID=1404 RepID=UPI0013E2AC47|nr:hypothetical protein [Priestia megaterium]MED4147122.1 hypothetical protein [Priestia megaterium]MED4170686.1 hypothetical protein [Priestia megaterium]